MKKILWKGLLTPHQVAKQYDIEVDRPATVTLEVDVDKVEDVERNSYFIVEGDVIRSDFFNGYLLVVKIYSDDNWFFQFDGKILKARTPLSHIMKRLDSVR